MNETINALLTAYEEISLLYSTECAEASVNRN